MRGESVAADVGLGEAVDLMPTDVSLEEGGYGYDVQFLIVGQGLDVDAIRRQIVAMGECPLVVGDPSTVKVHVHVPDPGVPISYGASLGSLRDVVVEDMQAQYQDFIVQHEVATEVIFSPSEEFGIVAVVMGDGLTQVFRSLGVEVIVPGGQTMNPSTQELIEAIERVSAPQVILLPNNGNVILAAEQARQLSQKPVSVIPTRSAPQGIAALLAINAQADFETNVAAMTQAVGDVEVGEVTVATRSTNINGLPVADGQVIGLHNGELAVVGEVVEEVVRELLEHMGVSNYEVITLYYGEDVTEDQAMALADDLAAMWPEQEIEVVAGGQPHYFYILSVE